jgi:hypothetical protein
MNELKQQIVYMRQAMFSKGMTRELEGFDTAIRLFADTKKKSFKEKAAEVWKKHKGKILAGAAIAGAAGLGAYGGKKLLDKKAEETVKVVKAPLGDKVPTVDDMVERMKSSKDFPAFWPHLYPDTYAKAVDKFMNMPQS